MTITEPARHRLYEKLEGLLGMDDAATMMAHLPPVGWADVATRADLDQLHDRIHIDLADIRVEVANVRTQMVTFESGLRQEMAGLESGLRQDLAEVHVEMANLRTDLRHELALFRDQQQRDQLAVQRQLIFVVIAAALSLLGTLAIAV